MNALTWALRPSEEKEAQTWLEKVSKKMGRKFASLIGVPVLNETEQFYMQAFWHLSASRQSGGLGVSPILISEMLAYCGFRLIQSADRRMDLLYYVQALDASFMQQMSARLAGNNAG